MTTLVHGKCTPPIGGVYCGQVYCQHCMKLLIFPPNEQGEFTGPDLCVFFKCTEWGYLPQCHICMTVIAVPLTRDPKIVWPHGLIVTHVHEYEVAQIQRWAFGSHGNYYYEVQCAEDGELLVWSQHEMVKGTNVRWR